METSLPRGLTIEPGDMVLFIGKDRRTFIRTMTAGLHLQTHFGMIYFDDIIGVPYGEQVRTHLGHSVYVIPPSIDDIVKHLKRETQIIYPKDLGYIVMKMSIMPGVKVIEAGTGSGALTMLLAMLVGEEGHVFSYEHKAKMQDLARKNVAKIGLEHRVSFIERDIREGFDQTGVHAVFLDVPTPWEFLDQARAALRGGGFFGALVPTTNQLSVLLEHLYHGKWYLLQAEEILLRQWKTIPARVRPDDQMVGHTGFLVFARAVDREVRSEPEESVDYEE
jgi:tRNA (adenine57-N1/adenine58-N1)-methyltransferase catalytic subunit